MTRWRRKGPVGGAVVLAVALAGGAAWSETAGVFAERLLWHVETADEEVLGSRLADEPFNPASVVKVATSLRALERLGPEFRFETRLVPVGELDPASGVLRGDLVVLGGGDPDFHWENAFLVARALADRGLREVTGSILVDDTFWIGWEGGSEKREHDPVRRATQMATRLRTALDSNRWTRAIRDVWTPFAARLEAGQNQPPRIVVRGGVGRWGGGSTGDPLVVHRSKTLLDTLKRLNAYSNNDIERLEAVIGSAEEMSRDLAARWGATNGEVRFDTLSGLGTNRLTPRLAVRLMRDLARSCRKLGCQVDEVLPVAGCDPGTLRHFPVLSKGEAATAVAAKTGTLTTTDGGVSVLAGFANTGEGERIFCVAVPRSGYNTRAARQAEERWLVDVLRRNEGPRPYRCGPEVVDPSAGAAIYVP